VECLTHSPTRWSDHYLMLLSGVLLGYAMMGKGFAYIGIPPIFIGECAFLLGLVVFARTGCFIAVLATVPALLLAAMMMWVLLRTLPYLDVYGLNAARDSVVVLYGAFAFIVAALLLEDSRRIGTVIRLFRGFLGIYVPAIPFLFGVRQFEAGVASIPYWPHFHVPVLFVGTGEVAVHLAGAVVFVLAGFRRMNLLEGACAVVALAMALVLTRGGMMAFVIPVVLAMLFLGKIRQLITAILAGSIILLAASAIEANFGDPEVGGGVMQRRFSATQIVANAQSVIAGEDKGLESTKTWRLAWWNIIIGDTVFGPYFWSGRGFGLNLADADGFQHRQDPNSPLLRSPHNVQMTMLARAGVPGLALWLLFLASWFGMMIRTMLVADRRGHAEWAALFVFIGCYALAFVINATFDTSLEGPVQGIWFWSLIGFGMGAVMVYRAYSQSPLAVSDRRQSRDGALAGNA
jgi:O-Antigen ligase